MKAIVVFIDFCPFWKSEKNFTFLINNRIFLIVVALIYNNYRFTFIKAVCIIKLWFYYELTLLIYISAFTIYHDYCHSFCEIFHYLNAFPVDFFQVFHHVTIAIDERNPLTFLYYCGGDIVGESTYRRILTYKLRILFGGI